VTDLVIDQLARQAEQAPDAPLFPGRSGDGWPLLTNAEAWARSGAVASWLIAQGFGPLGKDGRGRSLAVQAADSPQRAVLLLGALRAGAPVVGAPLVGAPLVGEGAALTFVADKGRLVAESGIDLAALTHCSIDAAVAERRLHIDAATPARLSGESCRRHGDLSTIAQAVAD
jgi:feruloyl-CoA synthase